MTTEKTSKKPAQKPTKQIHYYQVTHAIEITTNSFFAQLGYEPMSEHMKTSMIAGIIFHRSRTWNPRHYFDFSGIAPLETDEILRKLRCSIPIEMFIKGDLLAVYRVIKKSFPAVRRK